MNTDENPPTPKPASQLQPEQLFHAGTMAEQVEVMMGVLTQGVVDCMIFATGAYPNLTEGSPEEPNAIAKPKPGGLSTWQSARSAELRDAARLTEASARLLTGFAKYRGQFSQDFTIRHGETRKPGDAKKKRQRHSTITHRFSVPAREAPTVASLDPETTAERARKAAAAASLAEAERQARAAQEKAEHETSIDELYRICGVPRPKKDDAVADAPPVGDPPPPPPET